jgi:DNA-3-methyladenine glycosylase I
LSVDVPLTSARFRRRRCDWAGSAPHMIRYHDAEWGRPVHEDRRLFEMLLLEGAQAGLTWDTVLRRREGYRTAFAGFDPVSVAAFGPREKRALMNDPRIIRNRLKIEAAVSNAKAFLAIQYEFGSFNHYVWQFVGGKAIVNRRKYSSGIPATTPHSDALSRDLRKRGFRFVGSTIIYAFMQAVGMVNDHTIDCFRAAKPPRRRDRKAPPVPLSRRRVGAVRLGNMGKGMSGRVGVGQMRRDGSKQPVRPRRKRRFPRSPGMA